jgi:hypothetical protein
MSLNDVSTQDAETDESLLELTHDEIGQVAGGFVSRLMESTEG